VKQDVVRYSGSHYQPLGKDSNPMACGFSFFVINIAF